jgi:putative ABC transport system permease protein
MAAVVTLALGIAANTTMFGFMNAILLRPFPLLDADGLVSVWETHPQQGAAGGHGKWSGDENPLAVADYLELRAQAPGIESVAAYRYNHFVMIDSGDPERVPGYLVTPGYFETLRLRPALGRTFRAEEGAAGSDAVVILSHGFWQRHFAGSGIVLGRSVDLGGRSHAVVGVLPPGANFPPGAPDVFVPLVLSEAEKTERARLSLLAVARLKDEGELRGAQASLDAFSARLARDYPDTNTGRTLRLVPLAEMQTGFITPFLLLFEGAAVFVLLIACVNVAGLLIAQGARREQEMALRAALGASRGRMVRQLLTEGFVLSLLGATAALWLAQGGVDLVRTSLPPDHVRWIPGWSQIRLEWRTLAFTLGLTVATTLAFALWPAMRVARVDLVETLKAGARSMAGAPRRRFRGGLVALQVTLALVLMVGAALMTRGFLGLASVYQGIDPERVVTLRLKLPEGKYREPSGVAAFYERIVRELEISPGVVSAAVVSHPPADLGPVPRTSFVIEGQTLLRPEEKPAADFQTVSAGYFKALGIAVRQGRGLIDADGAGAPPVALVSASLAARFWPGEDPVGRRIQMGDARWRTVVGVVGDVKQYWFDREPRPTVYVSHAQSPRREMFLVIRSSLPLPAVVAAARARVRAADREQPIDEIRSMATIVSESASFIRLAAALMTIFGLTALLLAAVGLHGVLAEHVARRTREIGIRMALGARRADVLRLVMGRVARLAGLGLAVGLVGAIALGRFMADALFSVVQPDPATIAGVTAFLAAVSLAAAWLPSRRALRIDPMTTLRDG